MSRVLSIIVKMRAKQVTFVVAVMCFCAVNGFNLENREPIIKRGAQGTYFGYAVAQHKMYNDHKTAHNWLLVGAPLGHNLQPGTNRSGALFKCPISYYTDDCRQVPTDGRRSEESPDLFAPRNDEIKDGQWMGVTVKSQGPEGMVLVCAHRYVTVGRGDSRSGQGLCYTLTNELEYENAYEPCKGRSIKREHQDYSLCQTGTSGALLADGNAIFGAPGPYTWRGTLFVQTVDGEFLSRDKTVYMGPLADTPDPVDKYSYLGMSVSAGNFISEKETLFAAGAPRSNETGQVVIFNKTHSISIMNVVMKLNGEQFASSFGYEMASADVNGDGKSDLLVGAPFYFSRNEGGAVYVYTDFSCKWNCQWNLKLTGKLESRFGFAISGLGDINKDGFEDVAIGAPYEEDGAVYIYLGSKNGLIKEYSQKLLPLKTGITTLGYSLSGGQDMDENGYPDLLVGAYETDTVIMYRGRVIIDINTNITESELRNIDPSKQKCLTDPRSNTTCVTFKACCTLKLQASGTLKSGQSLNYTIEAETFSGERKFSRVYFKTDNDQKHNIIVRSFKLESNKYSYCQNETVYLKENTRDILSPIKFRLNYTLGNDEPHSAILNKQKSETIFKATFQKDCGDNDICESNLILDARLILEDVPGRKDEYILTLGEENELKVDITVNNRGEPAYETQLFVEHHSSLSYIAIGQKTGNIICNYRNETLVVCNLGNPFKKDQQVKVFLRFEPKNLSKTQKKLNFNIFVNSTSKETSKRTSAHLTANVVKRAEVTINGAATSHVFYGGEVKGESLMKYFDDIGSRVVHTYQVVNNGPWKLEHFEVHIDWPFQVANNKPLGKWLLYMEERPIIEGGEICKTPEDAINPLDLTIRPGTQDLPPESDMISSYQDSSYNTSHSRSKRDTEMVIKSETFIDNDGHKREIVNMNCQNGTAKCVPFRCTIKNLEKKGEVTIKIRSRLWNSTLVEDYPRIDWVRIVSTARIVIPSDYAVEQDISDDVAMVETLAYPDLKEQEAEPAPLWIIIVAVVAGLLLLILLTLLLWKLGFFKRQRIDQTLSGNLEKHSREGEPFLSS